jgi:hypothetical protein
MFSQVKIVVKTGARFKANLIAVNDSEIVYTKPKDGNNKIRTMKLERIKMISDETDLKNFQIYKPKYNVDSLTRDKIVLRSVAYVKGSIVEVNDSQVNYIKHWDKKQRVYTISKREVRRIKYGTEKINGPNIKDTNRYISFGIIPYQFLGRSFGGYLSYKTRKGILVDYRATYTIPTSFYNYRIMGWVDRYYFRGLNHLLHVECYTSSKRSIGIIIGYRHWWYKKEMIPNGQPTHSSYFGYIKRSEILDGVTLGLGTSRDLSFKKFSSAFYTNISITSFNEEVLGVFHFAIGFKLGGRIKLPSTVKKFL